MTHTPPRQDFGPVSVHFGQKNGKYPDGNQVIVRGTDTRAVLDAMMVSNFIGEEFDTADLVVMSHVHEDHMAGLHRLPGVPVHVHDDDLVAARSWEGLAAAFGYDPAAVPEIRAQFERDFFYAPQPDAIAYADGATWDLGGQRIRAFHAPGHTAGHCILLIEPAGVAFIADIDLTGFGPYYADASSTLAGFRRTLDLLPQIPAKVWITAHHRGVYTDREKMLADLDAYRAKLDEREQRLLALLADRPKSLDDLVAERLLYPPGYESPFVVMAETRTIAQHLDELIAQGRVRTEGQGLFRHG